MNSYCSESVELMNLMDQMDRDDDGDTTPILAFFGDGSGLTSGKHAFEIPLIAKYRAVSTKDYASQFTGDNLCEEPRWKETLPPPRLRNFRTAPATRSRKSYGNWNLIHHWKTLPGALRKDTPWKTWCLLCRRLDWIVQRQHGPRNMLIESEMSLCSRECRFQATVTDARIALHLGVFKSVLSMGHSL